MKVVFAVKKWIVHGSRILEYFFSFWYPKDHVDNHYRYAKNH